MPSSSYFDLPGTLLYFFPLPSTKRLPPFTRGYISREVIYHALEGTAPGDEIFLEPQTRVTGGVICTVLYRNGVEHTHKKKPRLDQNPQFLTARVIYVTGLMFQEGPEKLVSCETAVLAPSSQRKGL